MINGSKDGMASMNHPSKIYSLNTWSSGDDNYAWECDLLPFCQLQAFLYRIAYSTFRPLPQYVDIQASITPQ
jgi:hypothetical protein